MTHTWTLILKIDDAKGKATYYRLTPLEPNGRVAARAWRLEKKDGTAYDVHLDRHGIHCSCADSTFRRQNAPEPCKHGAALKALTLLEPLYVSPPDSQASESSRH